MTVSLKPVSQGKGSLLPATLVPPPNGSRPTTSNFTKWTWIGWASSVKLWIFHSSVAPRAGFSVIRSLQSSGLPVPSERAAQGRCGSKSFGRRIATGQHNVAVRIGDYSDREGLLFV